MKKLLISMLTLFVGVSAHAVDRRAVNRTFVPATPRVITSNVNKVIDTKTAPTISQMVLPNMPQTAPSTGVSTADQKYIDEIKARYAVSYGKVKTNCSDINEKLNKLKVVAGITTGTSVVGTLGGGTATITGFRTEPDEPIYPTEEVKKLENIDIKETDKIKTIVDLVLTGVKGLLTYRDKYDAYMAAGVTRTVGSFTAGGANVAGATTTFIGLGEFDNLISEISFCNTAIDEIQKEKTELSTATSGASEPDPLLAKMGDVIENCDGLESKNISDIKGMMVATGAIVSVSAATGIAGGITSLAANSKPKDKKPNTTDVLPSTTTDKTIDTTAALSKTTNTDADKVAKDKLAQGADKDNKGSKGPNAMDVASNILAVVTTAGSLAGTITSGMTLASLEKNIRIAEKCEEFLQ